MKRFLITCSIILIVMSSQAQNKNAKWNVGFIAGITQYKGSLSNNFYKFNTSANSVYGATISRYMAERLDLNLLIGRGGVGVDNNSTYFVNYFSTAMLSMRVHILSRTSIVRPYLIIGVGTMLYDNNSNIKADRTTVIAPSYGGGININLGASARLNIQEAFHHTSADKIDINVPDEKATFLFHTIAVTFDLSKKHSK